MDQGRRTFLASENFPDGTGTKIKVSSPSEEGRQNVASSMSSLAKLRSS